MKAEQELDTIRRCFGLTNTAKRLAEDANRMIVKQLDRPTKFTLRRIRYQRANMGDCASGRLHSRVYIMDKQTEYLSLQIKGGTRTSSGAALPVRTKNVKLNKYGNILGGQARIRNLLYRKHTSQGTINSFSGI